MSSQRVRIGRFLSQVGLCSRRGAADFLKEHEVLFLGRRISDLSFKIDEDQLANPVRVDGKEYHWRRQQEVILLNKPVGYVCSHKTFPNEKSVFTLLEPSQRDYFFAGRLDKNSRGLVVFSNNGQLIYRLTHPSFEVKKVYHVHVRPPLDKASIQKSLKGLSDGKDKLRFDKLEPLKHPGHYEVVLHRGKNREIRRLMKRLGRWVIDLKRVQIGDFRLDDLQEGRSKSLDKLIVQIDAPRKKVLNKVKR